MSLDTAIIQQYYAGILRLTPSAATINAYAQLPSYEAAMDAMMNAAVSSVNPITQLYQAAFDRVPDTNGLTNFTAAYGAGSGTMSLLQIANQWATSAEFLADYPPSMPNADFVGLLYWNVLHRSADPAGAANFTAALNAGVLTRAQVLLELSQSTEFTDTMIGHIEGFQQQCALNNPAAYTGSLWDKVPPGPGETITLTTNIDTIDISGHAVNTVIGVQQATNGTWNTGDTINGNGLTNINLVANGLTVGAASIVDANNIASINVNLAADTGINSSEFTDVAQVAVTNGIATKALTVASANLATTYAVKQARATTIDLDSFSNDLDGTADAVNLSVTGAGSKISAAATFDLGGNAIEIANIATSGTNYVALADAASVEEINITGNGTNSVNVGALLATGVSVTGGSGTDTIYGAPAAGTSAATLSGVEAVDVDFGNAGTYVSGVNWTGVTKVVANAATDSAVNFTQLKGEVATADIKLVHGNSVAVALGYATSSKGDLTVNVGSTTTDEYTDINGLTITNLTGALTINSKDSDAANVITGVTDAKATTLTVNSSAGTTFDDDVVTVKATSYAFNSTDGTTLDLNTSGQLVIGANDSKDRAITEIVISALGVNVDGDGSTTSLEVNDITTTAYENVVDVVTISTDADGTAVFDALEANASTLVIGSIDATGVDGDVTINVADLAVATEVTTGAGTADVTLTAGADTFTAGSGAVYVTTTNGADTITLGAAADTVELTQDDDNVTIADFTGGSKGDTVAADTNVWTVCDGEGDTQSTEAIDIVSITSAATTVTFTGTDNLLVVTGVIADSSALTDFLSDLTWTTALDDNDDILVAYFNGADTVLVTVDYDTTGPVVSLATTAATLTGVNTTALVNGNFEFVA